jgi:hypothetical protein
MEARLLALDTSTDRLAIGLGVGARDWLLDEPGGARASARLIGAIHELLERAGEARSMPSPSAPARARSPDCAARARSRRVWRSASASR